MSVSIRRREMLLRLGLGVVALSRPSLLAACDEPSMTSPTLTDWERTALRLQHRGHDIAYHCAGDGPALLLLHGFPSSSFDYAGMWSGLSERHRVIAFDMIGYGLSSKPAYYEYTIADQADIAEELCAVLGVGDCQVLCHDVGDTVCQELLARQFEGAAKIQIERVMLLNGGLFPETHRQTPLQEALLGPLPEVVLPLITRETFIEQLKTGGMFGPKTVPSPDVLDAMWQLVERDDGIQRWPQLIRYIEERKQFRERWVNALIRAPMPLRLIDGALDPVSGRHMAERYRELIPAPDVIMLDEVGHFPQLEVPDHLLQRALVYFRS